MRSAGPVAHVNVALLRHPWDDPRSAGFVDAVDQVNALAERSDGFVWRHGDEMGASLVEGMPFVGGDPRAAVSFSVWETALDLENFVYRTLHGSFFKRRAEWFEILGGVTYAIWPVPEGHIPTIPEAHEHLRLLADEGPSDRVFDFKYLRQHAYSEAE